MPVRLFLCFNGLTDGFQQFRKRSAEQKTEGKGQNNDCGDDDQLRFCPVAESIFLFFVSAPDEEHDKVYETADYGDEGNQRPSDPSAYGDGLLSGAGQLICTDICAAHGAETDAVIKFGSTVFTGSHNIYLFLFDINGFFAGITCRQGLQYLRRHR